MSAEPTVFIVDDDAAVRDGLTLLLETAHLKVRAFGSAAAFLAAYQPDETGCLVLDVRMPHTSGPELQSELKRLGIDLPIIFLSGHADIPTTVHAVKQGAMDFLTKPVDGSELLERVQAALQKSALLHERASSARALQSRLNTLTAREREILVLAAGGSRTRRSRGASGSVIAPWRSTVRA